MSESKTGASAPRPEPDCEMCEGMEPAVLKDVVQHCEGCCEARPLTIKEARELARRWAWWRDGGPESMPKPHTTDQLIENVDLMSAMCVTSEDIDRLFAWVRERMATAELSRNPDDWLPASTYLASIVGERLGLFEGARAARSYDDLVREALGLTLAPVTGDVDVGGLVARIGAGTITQDETRALATWGQGIADSHGSWMAVEDKLVELGALDQEVAESLAEQLRDASIVLRGGMVLS